MIIVIMIVNAPTRLQMILCDRCDRGFHMYCLAPVLKDVPEGDWFCRECHLAGKEVIRNHIHTHIYIYRCMSNNNLYE